MMRWGLSEAVGELLCLLRPQNMQAMLIAGSQALCVQLSISYTASCNRCCRDCEPVASCLRRLQNS